MKQAKGKKKRETKKAADSTSRKGHAKVNDATQVLSPRPHWPPSPKLLPCASLAHPSSITPLLLKLLTSPSHAFTLTQVSISCFLRYPSKGRDLKRPPKERGHRPLLLFLAPPRFQWSMSFYCVLIV